VKAFQATSDGLTVTNCFGYIENFPLPISQILISMMLPSQPGSAAVGQPDRVRYLHTQYANVAGDPDWRPQGETGVARYNQIEFTLFTKNDPNLFSRKQLRQKIFCTGLAFSLVDMQDSNPR
jgi:hypothetical protein